MKPIFITFIFILFLGSCQKNCVTCNYIEECAVCKSIKDSVTICYPYSNSSIIIDSMHQIGYVCTKYAGQKLNTNVCDNPNLQTTLKTKGWTCP